MKRIALVIANKGFRDEEFFIINEALTADGFQTDVFSNEIGLAIGRFGGEVEVKKRAESINPDDFDAIVFIGGSGAMDCLDNGISYAVIRSFAVHNKIIGAICISPLILAKTGVFEGKMATVWSSNMDKSAIDILRENKMKYVDSDIVIDKNIITGRDFEASSEFASAIITLLTK